MNPLDLMHRTPNGGYAVLSGKDEEFDAIPCDHTADSEGRFDTYRYANGINLRIPWGGEEFELVK